MWLFQDKLLTNISYLNKMFFIFSKWGTPLSGFPAILEIGWSREKLARKIRKKSGNRLILAPGSEKILHAQQCFNILVSFHYFLFEVWQYFNKVDSKKLHCSLLILNTFLYTSLFVVIILVYTDDTSKFHQ